MNDADARLVTKHIHEYIESRFSKVIWHSSECLWSATNENQEMPLTYYCQLYVERFELVFYIVPEFPIFEETVSDVVEYLTRVNLGLRIGNFEFDYNEMKIRFKSGICFAKEVLTKSLIAGTVEPALMAWDEYFLGAVDVMSGLETPSAALSKIEASK